MILADDNFVTIVEAVKTGRHIYANIKKAIHFLIATNIGEIVAIFFGLLLGLETPLLAIQLLWINLVTDSFPAIALGMEPAEKDIMNRKPNGDPIKGINTVIAYITSGVHTKYNSYIVEKNKSATQWIADYINNQ